MYNEKASNKIKKSDDKDNNINDQNEIIRFEKRIKELEYLLEEKDNIIQFLIYKREEFFNRNQIEYIDSIELLYSKHYEWTTIPSDINTLIIKGNVQPNNKMEYINDKIEYINEFKILRNEKPENIIEEKDKLVNLFQPKEPLKTEYNHELFIQIINEIEILKVEKPDNQIEYIDSIELLYSKHGWTTIPSDYNTFTIKRQEKAQTNSKIEYTNEFELLGQEKLENVIEERDQLVILSQFSFELSGREKIISIIFISFDQNIISSFICKNTDIFNSLENKFYEKYSEYKNLDNIFISNGRKIDKNKSLDENKIKNNDIITIFN